MNIQFGQASCHTDVRHQHSRSVSSVRFGSDVSDAVESEYQTQPIDNRILRLAKKALKDCKNPNDVSEVTKTLLQNQNFRGAVSLEYDKGRRKSKMSLSLKAFSVMTGIGHRERESAINRRTKEFAEVFVSNPEILDEAKTGILVALREFLEEF